MIHLRSQCGPEIVHSIRTEDEGRSPRAFDVCVLLNSRKLELSFSWEIPVNGFLIHCVVVLGSEKQQQTTLMLCFSLWIQFWKISNTM